MRMLQKHSHRTQIEQLERRTMLAAQLDSGLFTVTGTAGADTIEISTANNQATVKMNGQTQVFALPARISVKAYGGSDTVNILSAIPAIVVGGAGDDTIRGGQAGDELRGGGGNDSISAGDGYDTVYGGLGHDSLHAGFTGAELHGGDGNDVLNLSDDGGIAYGDAGDDRLLTYGGGTLRGGEGNDLLRGSVYVDSLYGEGGNDTLHSGGMADVMDGGTGTNVFA